MIILKTINTDDTLFHNETIDIVNNRLNIMFKFLWFFGSMFLLGYKLLISNNILDASLTENLLYPLIFSIALFMIFELIGYIIGEIRIFVGNDIREENDMLYKSIVNDINFIKCYLVIYCLLSYFLPYFKFNIYSFKYSFAITALFLITLSLRKIAHNFDLNNTIKCIDLFMIKIYLNSAFMWAFYRTTFFILLFILGLNVQQVAFLTVL